MLTNRIHKNNLSYKSKQERLSTSPGYTARHELINMPESKLSNKPMLNSLISLNLFSEVLSEGSIDSQSEFIDKLGEELFGIRSLFSIMNTPKQNINSYLVMKNPKSEINDDFYIHEALLNLQSWWERIRRLRYKSQFTVISGLCISLPENINCFISVYKELLKNEEHFTLSNSSNFFLDTKLYEVLMGVVGSSEKTKNIIYNLSIQGKIFEISEMSDKDKTKLLHIVYSYTFLFFVSSIFKYCGKYIDIPKWKIFNTSHPKLKTKYEKSN